MRERPLIWDPGYTAYIGRNRRARRRIPHVWEPCVSKPERLPLSSADCFGDARLRAKQDHEKRRRLHGRTTAGADRPVAGGRPSATYRAAFGPVSVICTCGFEQSLSTRQRPCHHFTSHHEKLLAYRHAPRPIIAGRGRHKACPAYRRRQLHIRIVRPL